MYTYNIKRSFSALLILSTLMYLGAGLFAPFVQAQGVTSANFCPISGLVSTSVTPAIQEENVETSLSTVLSIYNPSEHVFGGGRVGVAIYQKGIEPAPMFWTVLPDELLLMPNEKKDLPVTLNLSALPAGDFYYQTFFAQGDDLSVLGTAIRDADNSPRIDFKKSTPSDFSLQLNTSINGNLWSGGRVLLSADSPLEVEFQTVNTGESLYGSAQVILAINEGAVPLGTAVRKQTTDNLKILPGSSRVTSLNEGFVDGQSYLITAALLSDNTPLPLVAIPVEVEGQTGKSIFSYFSQVGLSSYPVEPGTKIVACFDHIGASSDLVFPTEPLGANFRFEDNSGNIIQTTEVTTSDSNRADYFEATINQPMKDFTSYTDLLQERFKGVTPASPQYDPKTDTELQLVAIGTITQSFKCSDITGCTPDTSSTLVNQGETNLGPSSWFYLGVTLAALLLGIFMVGRLRQREEAKPQIEYTKPESH